MMTFTRWCDRLSYFCLMLGLIFACRGDAPPPPADVQDTATTEVRPRTRMAAPPMAAPRVTADTTHWTDSDTRGDTTFYSKGRAITSVLVLTDSQWFKVTLPSFIGGIPFGGMQVPADTLCTLGYSGGMIPVRDPATIVAEVQRAGDCGARVFINAQQPKFREVADSGSRISVANAVKELDRWPWQQLCQLVKDGTLLGTHLGDDLTHPQWGVEYSVRDRVIKWDSIMGHAAAKCPEAARLLRMRPTQLQPSAVQGYVFKHLTTAWLQWSGPRRMISPDSVLALEVPIAKRMRIGLVIGLNVEDGGCGPTTYCLPGVPGTTAAGTDGRWQMSVAEVKYVGERFAKAPYSCAFISWGWGFGGSDNFFSKPENRAALASLRGLAQKHPPTRCIPS